MTRAYKLAVTIWGVMALSGCASLRNHDKPNTSDPHKNITSKQLARQKPVDKTTADYLRGRDSLEKALKDEALTIMDAPITIVPVALPSTAFETYALKTRKIKPINPSDSSFTRHVQYVPTGNGMFTMFSPVPFVDCDEILHEAAADSADYVSYEVGYSSGKKIDYLIAVDDLKMLRDNFARKPQGNFPEKGKLYLSFQGEANAYYLNGGNASSAGLNPGFGHALITLGYLQTRDKHMAKSTLAHERAHADTEAILTDYMMRYGKKYPQEYILNAGAEVLQVKRYGEYLADSTGFADEITVSRDSLLGVTPNNLAAVKRWKVDYQQTKKSVASFIETVSTRDVPMATAFEVNDYNKNKKFMDNQTSFANTVDNDRTHPNNIKRIYYLMIHQRRARELKQNGKTALYAQYGDLLPRPPAIEPQQTQPGSTYVP